MEKTGVTEEPSQIPLDAAMMTSLTAVAAVAVALSLGALGAFGWSSAMGVATGGLLATLNLWLIGLVSRGVLSGGRHGRLWGIAGGLKFLALLGVAFGLLQAGLTTALTLAIGYAALPLGVTVGTVIGQRRSAS
jgi:hypothetical protein